MKKQLPQRGRRVASSPEIQKRLLRSELRVALGLLAVVVMVAGRMPAPQTVRAEGYLVQNNLFAYENSDNWKPLRGGQAAQFIGDGADTCQFIIWWGNNLSPWANDCEFAVRADTSLAVSTGDLTGSIMVYPIVNDPDDARILTHPNALGEVLWEKGIYLTETTTGRSSNGFTFNPDSTFIFHSTTWWSGMETLGYLARAIMSDSLYFGRVWEQHRQRD